MADIPNPQEQLRTTLAGLATSLQAALSAVQQPNVSPAMLAAALNGVGQATTSYNQAVIRIPMQVMTDGRLIEDMTMRDDGESFKIKGLETHIHREFPLRRDAAEGEAIPPGHPAAELISDNPRVWADRFLVENKNHAIDRESLTHWFGYAIAAGAQSVESARTLWDRARATTE